MINAFYKNTTHPHTKKLIIKGKAERIGENCLISVFELDKVLLLQINIEYYCQNEYSAFLLLIA